MLFLGIKREEYHRKIKESDIFSAICLMALYIDLSLKASVLYLMLPVMLLLMEVPGWEWHFAEVCQAVQSSKRLLPVICEDTSTLTFHCFYSPQPYLPWFKTMMRCVHIQGGFVSLKEYPHKSHIPFSLLCSLFSAELYRTMEQESGGCGRGFERWASPMFLPGALFIPVMMKAGQSSTNLQPLYHLPWPALKPELCSFSLPDETPVFTYLWFIKLYPWQAAGFGERAYNWNQPVSPIKTSIVISSLCQHELT